MKDLLQYIIESKLVDLDIDAIKEFLTKRLRCRTWEECVDKQKFGDCDRLCRMIAQRFPNTFDGMYDMQIEYSDIAVKKLKEIGDDGPMFGNHYVLTRKGNIYDFAKGANSISGIYLMTAQNDMKDKYTIKYSKDEYKCITYKIRRFLKW
jgi:hypothetical protein